MANDREAELHHPLADTLPASGTSIEIAPGVRWLRMALPFVLDHINLWLLRDRLDLGQGPVDGWTIVDCGIADEATRAAWEQVFARDLEGLPVLRVICTHMHPDHIGLADWLTRRWSRAPADGEEGLDCRLWISSTDWSVARDAVRVASGYGGDSAAAFFASHGLRDPEALDQVRRRSGHYASLVPAVPARFRRLMDRQRLSIGAHGWHCLAGYGHAPEHIALHCPALGVLISGDMVLPRISTNVSVIDLEPEANPLALYLDSLAAMRSLPADTLVLPSHGRPFVGLHTRLDQLAEHHEERLSEVMTACREQPRDAASLLPLLFRRRLDAHQTPFAMGEAVAHLHLPWLDGRLERRREADGVWRFRAVAA